MARSLIGVSYSVQLIVAAYSYRKEANSGHAISRYRCLPKHLFFIQLEIYHLTGSPFCPRSNGPVRLTSHQFKFHSKFPVTLLNAT
jgi:hypothetical protein